MKEDLMSKALKEFWGGSEATEEKLSPEDAAKAFESEGRSIREKVESGIEETEDLTPETPKQVQKKKPAPFDLGGLDEMNRKQLARERGMGLSIDFSGSREKLPFDEKYHRELARQELADTKSELEYKRQERRLLLQQNRLNVAQQAAQLRNQNLTTAEIARTIREEATKKRYDSGLPVYEGPLDLLAGGRRKKFTVVDGKTVDTGEFERVGGLFGAARETYGAWKEAKPHIDSGIEKTKKSVEKHGGKALTKVKEGGKEFVSNTTGVFNEAKMNVKSYFDQTDIDRAVNDLNSNIWDKVKQPQRVSSYKFPDNRDFKNMWAPKQERKVNRNAPIVYEGRDLSPVTVNRDALNPNINEITYPKPAFINGPASFVDTPGSKRSAGIVNSVMAMFGNDKSTKPVVTNTKGIDLTKLNEKK